MINNWEPESLSEVAPHPVLWDPQGDCAAYRIHLPGGLGPHHALSLVPASVSVVTPASHWLLASTPQRPSQDGGQLLLEPAPSWFCWVSLLVSQLSQAREEEVESALSQKLLEWHSGLLCSVPPFSSAYLLSVSQMGQASQRLAERDPS